MERDLIRIRSKNFKLTTQHELAHCYLFLCFQKTKTKVLDKILSFVVLVFTHTHIKTLKIA
jgi:hypothetical protein